MAARRRVGQSHTLAERWDGPAWTVQDSPNPGIEGPNGATLAAIACGGPRRCTAVGGLAKPFDNGGLALALRWDGRSWSDSAGPADPHLVSAALRGVDCPRAAECVAVGQSVTAGVGEDAALAVVWSPMGWRPSPVAGPAGAVVSDLEAVACPSPRSCVAVGGYYADVAGRDHPFAETWDRRRWPLARLPS